MPRALIPDYVGQDFRDATPGLRHGPYIELWDHNRMADAKVDAICAATVLPQHAQVALKALRDRQQAVAETIDASQVGIFFAESTAPLATGLGMEHPTENGFAFLSPYGLPYLPGSSVKGAVRRAAEELASGDWGNPSAWNKDDVYVLFGPESTDDGRQGAIQFWDVYPQVAHNRIAVEIMTPHQTHYYQDEKSPHDSGSPNPIPFLAVPAGSKYVFHVVTNPRRLHGSLGKRWNALLEAAFEHAFDWVGFGAKTAVGYGAMRPDEHAKRSAEAAAEERRKVLEREKGLKGLPADAAWLKRREADWTANNSVFLNGLEAFFHEFEEPGGVSDEAIRWIRNALDERWPGIMQDPNAVQGKRRRPKHRSANARALACKVLALESRQEHSD